MIKFRVNSDFINFFAFLNKKIRLSETIILFSVELIDYFVQRFRKEISLNQSFLSHISNLINIRNTNLKGFQSISTFA